MTARRTRLIPFLLAGLIAGASAGARADATAEAYRAMGLKVGDVLAGTVLSSQVLPGQDKQVVAVVTYFTGRREQATAVNVKLFVFRRDGDALAPVFSRDLGAERQGNVANGDLLLVDLDRDGLSEIVLSYDDTSSTLIRQRLTEILLHDPDRGFHTGWSGPVEYDATKAARDVPAERRDRFERQLDIPATMRSRGLTVFFTKKVIAVAGERLPEPKLVQETFPLRSPPEGW